MFFGCTIGGLNCVARGASKLILNDIKVVYSFKTADLVNIIDQISAGLAALGG